MARPPSITDDEVLAAARAVLLAKGISATVEEVAERCHVGVATIFRRFPTKQALFLAAFSVSNDAEWLRFVAEQEETAGDAEPHDRFIHLANVMLETARKMVPLMLMRLSSPNLEDKASGTERAKWVLRSLTGYFEKERAAGRMADMDPRVAARVWIGSIRHIAMLEHFAQSPDDLSTEQFIHGLADLFSPPAPKKRKRTK